MSRKFLGFLAISTLITPFLWSADPVVPRSEFISSVWVRDDLKTLDQAIKATKLSLGDQERLRGLVLELQTVQDAHLKDQDNKALAIALMRTTHQVLNLVDSEHMEHLLQPQFLSELRSVDKITKKDGLARP